MIEEANPNGQDRLFAAWRDDPGLTVECETYNDPMNTPGCVSIAPLEINQPKRGDIHPNCGSNGESTFTAYKCYDILPVVKAIWEILVTRKCAKSK